MHLINPLRENKQRMLFLISSRRKKVQPPKTPKIKKIYKTSNKTFFVFVRRKTASRASLGGLRRLFFCVLGVCSRKTASRASFRRPPAVFFLRFGTFQNLETPAPIEQMTVLIHFRILERQHLLNCFGRRPEQQQQQQQQPVTQNQALIHSRAQGLQ